MLITIIKQFIPFLYCKIIDLYRYYKYKQWRDFDGFGLHIYCGMFGSGKTSTMVHDAFILAKTYPQLTILTNMHLSNFPSHTNIIELKDYKQIVTSPENTLIIIDEISSIFNSRDWKKGGIPAPLLGTLLQVRKQNKMLYATAQRFIHVDALFRQITFTVRECECWRGRWNWVRTYDGFEYDNSNIMRPATLLNLRAFVQTDNIRGLYDTRELVEKMKTTDYLDSGEILENQGSKTTIVVSGESEKPKPKSGLFGQQKKK